ncbi:MAG: hypothetical protein HOE46_03095 [Candidatus Marinimicrobia bacterium]|jgi:hypothetical protein|nr:hypothetical protein [Candidatus Neomarinimicrobiota bacterium]MBT7424091.1 hypothetical protein [Candidatus Neomarinimicrobiota bacterium]
MNPKLLHNLTVIPFFILGITSFIMGFGWMLSSEPWMLDEYANTILLEESYKDLFAHPINENLPRYLTLLYRFFGLWVTTIGMLIMSFTIVTRLGTVMARNFIQSSFFITLIGISIIEYIFIPSSHFVYLTFVLWILWGVSVWAGIKLKTYDV